MASNSNFIALTIVFGFNAVLCFLQLLAGGGADTMTTILAQAWQSGGLAARLAAVALVPAVLATFTLTQLLSIAHARELVHANAAVNGGGGAVSRLVAGLARATLLAAALLVAAVVQLGADGHLDRGRGDVARLNIK